jgi:carboxypeptidase PM20D1
VLVHGFDAELELLGFPGKGGQAMTMTKDQLAWEGFAKFATLLRAKSISEDPSEGQIDAPTDPVEILLSKTMPSLYPLTYAAMRRIPLPTRSVVLELNGTSNPPLEPFMFLAHVDVVPVEHGTEKDWHRDPWGAGELIDEDGFMWGRGTLDNKANAASMLGAMEALLSRDPNWRPERTILFCFGHDEERGGDTGARIVAEKLPYRRLAGVHDEGGAMVHGMLPGVRAPIALIGVQEKGMVTLQLDIDDPSLSGHSSMPPTQSLVGLMAKALLAVEADKPAPSVSPVTREMLSSVAGDAAFPFNMIYANIGWLHPIMAYLLGASRSSSASVRTSIAPTVVNIGLKSNILPRTGRALVNYRIAPGDTIAELMARARRAIGDSRVKVSVVGGGTGFASDPSSTSRTDTPAYTALYETIGDLCPHCARTPYLVMGGTDARYFYPLTDSVYRFSPIHMLPSDVVRLHGTDERVAAIDFVSASAFYLRLLARVARADLAVTPGDQSHLEL